MLDIEPIIAVICNLYRLSAPTSEIERLFGTADLPGANFAAEVWSGYPGMVLVENELRVMAWGSLSMPTASGPVNLQTHLSEQCTRRQGRIHPIWRKRFR